MELVSLYKFKTNFTECIVNEKLFGNNLREYNKHFRDWIDWCIDYCGNVNVKSDGINRTISFKYGNKRYQAKWIKY